jgi:hypothetical protein
MITPGSFFPPPPLRSKLTSLLRSTDELYILVSQPAISPTPSLTSSPSRSSYKTPTRRPLAPDTPLAFSIPSQCIPLQSSLPLPLIDLERESQSHLRTNAQDLRLLSPLVAPDFDLLAEAARRAPNLDCDIVTAFRAELGGRVESDRMGSWLGVRDTGNGGERETRDELEGEGEGREPGEARGVLSLE